MIFYRYLLFIKNQCNLFLESSISVDDNIRNRIKLIYQYFNRMGNFCKYFLNIFYPTQHFYQEIFHSKIYFKNNIA